MVILNNNSVRLCRAGSCCMTVEKIDNSTFKFDDDYGSTIILSRKELSEIEFVKESDNKYSVSDKKGNKVIFNEDEKSIFIEDTIDFFKE